MVKQLVLDLHINMYNDTEDDIQQEFEANKKLLEVVTFYKNKITEFYNNKTWDRYKKLTNEYEMIFTGPNVTHNVSKFIPVSRSFFKLWEIIHDYQTILCPTDRPIRSLFLAEGPGGFAQAMMKFRQDYRKQHSMKDEFYGITLKANNNKNVPDWKYKHSKLHIVYGEDGTGNLYNIKNIKYLPKTLGANSFDFITADGGFDFSADFNNQEEMSLHLLTCEIYTAILMQKKGGTFVIKVFDLFSQYTLHLMYIISSCYESVKLIKPLTSRPANSEKYMICSNFRGCSEEKLSILHDILSSEWCQSSNVSQYHIDKICSINIHPVFLKNLVLFNTFYISRQVQYIQRTIEYIQRFTSRTMENGCIKKIIDGHIEKVKRWCQKYDIPT